jgi:hypothetical protein
MVSVNEAVDKGKGFDWDHYEREKFAGISITAANKREYRKLFINKYIDTYEFKVQQGDITEKELLDAADSYAMEHLSFHQKMERSHNKGKMFFQWRGKKERVWTTEYLSKMQKYMRDLEKAHIEASAAKKDQEISEEE